MTDILEKIKTGLLIFLGSVVVFFAFVFLGGLDFTDMFEEETVVDEYGYTLEDDALEMDLLIEYYGGQESFIYDDVFDETYLYLSSDDELHYYVDDDVSAEYLEIFEAAIQEFNDLGYITITYEIIDIGLDADGYPEYDFSVNQLESFDTDMSDAMAYNMISWDSTGDINYSAIYLSGENYDMFEYDVLVALLIHEIGHTFGLVDLYDWDFADDSIMFYIDVENPVLGFTEFDLYNLEFMYLEDYVAPEIDPIVE